MESITTDSAAAGAGTFLGPRIDRYASSHFASLTVASSRTTTIDPIAYRIPRSHISARELPGGAATNSAPLLSTVLASAGPLSRDTTMSCAPRSRDARPSVCAARRVSTGVPADTTTTERDAHFSVLATI